MNEPTAAQSGCASSAVTWHASLSGDQTSSAVQEGDQVAADGLGAAVARPPHPAVWLADQRQPRVVDRLDQLCGAVLRAVVDHDERQVPVGLVQDAAHCSETKGSAW
jgi:hypothetical protein